MARNIKGITIELGADTSKLNKALKTVQKEAKNLENEIRKVDKALQLDPGNADLVKQKMLLLDDAVDETEKSLNEMKEALAKANSEGMNEKNSASYRRLQREIAKTESSLSGLRSEQSKVAAESSKLGKLSSSMSDFASSCETASSKLSAVSKTVGAIAGAATLASESTREYRDDIAKLNTAFEVAGWSANSGQKAYKALFQVIGEEDRSVETANHLAQLCDTQEQLSQWTDICAGVWATFGDSLPIEGLTEAANETAKTGAVTGVLADALNWLGASEDSFNEKLAACSSEQERAALITDTLSGLYSDAADTFKENNKSVMDARAAQQELTDSTAELGEAMEPLVTTGKELITSVLEKLVPLFETLGSLPKGLQTAIVAIAGLAVAIGPMIAIIGQIATGISVVSGALSALALGPVALIAAAIAAAIVIGVLIVKNWDKISAAAKKVGTAIVNFFKAIPEKIKAIFSKVANIGANIVKGIWNGIKGAKDWIFDKLTGWVKSVLKWIKKLFGIKSPSTVMRDQVGKYVALGLAEGMTDNIGAVTAAAQKLVGAATVTATSPTVSLGDVSDNISNAIGTGLAVGSSDSLATTENKIVINLGGAKVAEQIYKLNKQGQMVLTAK